ncbi:MAG: cob(I)yrinic acid a,c-diamide adenosyltransferase [Cellulosilyticaceae bacterium]
MKQGLVQIYCGEGKGKTTAAIGQGIRAIGNNMKVIMIQFLKDSTSSECKVLKTLEPKFKVFHFEKKRGFTWELNEEEKKELQEEINMALKFAKKVMDTGECDILILDELLGAVQTGFVEEKTLEELLINKPETMELIITGRVFPEHLKKYADYISVINADKHPMNEGIMARPGIEY